MFDFVLEYILWIVAVVVILISIVIFYYRQTYWSRTAKLVNKFPGAPILPILGNIVSFLGPTNDIHKKLSLYFKKYGTCCRLWIYNRPKLFIADESVFQVVLSSSELTEKGEQYDLLKDIVGVSLFNAPGTIWRRHRKLLNTSAFSRKFNDSYLQVFNRHSQILTEKLEEVFKSGIQPLDIYPLLSLCAMDMIFESSIGVNMGIQMDGQNSSYARAVAAYENGITLRLLRPWLTFPIVRTIVGYRKEEKASVEFAKEAMQRALKKKSEAILSTGMKENAPPVSDKKPKAKATPFMDVLLEAGEKFSDDEYFEYLVGMVLMGSGPVAASVMYTLLLLVQNPDHLIKVKEELLSVFPEESKTQDIKNKEVSKLTYLEMCLKEALRLFPPFPYFSRKIVFDLKLKNGQIIPKESDAVFSVYDLHRDPKTFPNPLNFDPERFTEKAIEERSPYAYMPFSGGVRNCVANKYSSLQCIVMLIHILRNFDIKMIEKPSEVNYSLPFLARPSPSLKFTFNKLKATSS